MQKPRDLSELHRIESAEDEPYRRARLSDWRLTERKSKPSELSDKMYRVGYLRGFKSGWYNAERSVKVVLDDDDLVDSILDGEKAELEKMYDIKIDGSIMAYRTKKDTETTDEQ